MEDESQQIFESLMPDMDDQSILNFQQNHFEVPEQMFADSSSSETYLEEVVIGPDISTTDIVAMPKSETIEEITVVKTATPTVPVVSKKHVPGVSKKPIAPFDPPNNNPPLMVANVLVNSEVLKPASNKLFLIPMGGIDSSLLQSSLKVPSGQNIIIVKPQDLLKSVEEQKLKLKAMSVPLNQHSLTLQQTKNINKQGIVTPGNQKESRQASLSQALPNVQAHGPSQVKIMQTNVMQPRKENHDGTSQPVLSQPKVVVQVLNTLGGPANLVNVGQQKVLQGSKLILVKNILQNKNKPVDQAQSSQGQTGKVSQQMPTKSALQVDGSKINPDNKAQPLGQSQPVTNLNNSNMLIQAQKSSRQAHGQAVKIEQEIHAKQPLPTDETPQHVINALSEPLNKDKSTTSTQANLKSPVVKFDKNVFQGVHAISVEAMGKPQQNMHRGQAKAVPSLPCIQLGKYLKITSPSKGTVSTESQIQIPRDPHVHQPQNLSQVTTIARPSNQAETQSKATLVSTQTSAPKIPSSRPVAAPQLHSYTQSVWPSTKQTVVTLESAVSEDKPIERRSQSHENELEKFGVTKTDTQRGPTLLGELEKRGYYSSSTSRMKNVRPGESQLKSLKHIKVNDTNTWTCCLCGKLSFANSLGCLFGPYDENKDGSQTECPVPGSKRNHDSTSDVSESPTKSKPEANSAQEFWFHGDCLVWSPGVYVVGDSLAGYRQAVNESRFSKCTYCGDYGASLACLQRTCKKLYHFPCAKETECIFEDSNYTIQCGHHK